MRSQRVLSPGFWLGFVCLLVAVLAPELAQANILDSVGQQYKSASAAWESSLIPIAKGLFIKLAAIEVLWSAIWWVLERDDPNQVLVSMLRKIMPLMFFWAILLNFDSWIPAIIDSFAQAGQTAGNTGPLTPSTILDRGLEVATTITTEANKIGLMSGPSGVGKFILAGLSALGILLCFGVIAGQMLVTLIESYIVVSGGVLFLGFAGSRWTTTFSEKFISYAVSVGVKLFVTYLIIGAGQTISNNWAAMITSDMVVADYLAVLVGSMVYMFLAWQIPSLASSMLTGAVSMTLGSAAATVGTMGAGAAGAAGLAQAGLQSGGNSIAGAVKAGNAAINQAMAGGASSFAGIAGGAAGAVGSAGMEAAKDGIKGLGAGTAGGSMANRINDKTASMLETAAAGSPAASVPGSQPNAPASSPTPSAGNNAPAAAQQPSAPAGSATPGTDSNTPAAAQQAESNAGQGEAARATPPAPTSTSANSAGSSTATQPNAPSNDKEDSKNALQQLSEHASALGNTPNDSAAGAGVQINLKHD